jgi:hypothetical protein
MSNAFLLFRSLVIYGICLPLAIFLGYLLATPLDVVTVSVVGLVLALLTVPLFLRWHYPWLILCWNMNAVAFFLPGKPGLAMVMCGISLMVSVLQHTLNKKIKFINVPTVIWPLLFLIVVVFATARLTGGIGLRVAGGDSYGGRRYLSLLSAVMGYFALTAQTIPPKRVVFYFCIFFLSALTAAMSNLAGVLAPGFNFLFLFFPLDYAGVAAITQEAVVGTHSSVFRLGGLAIACSSLSALMLGIYGVRGIFDLNKWWRLGLLFSFSVLAMLGGFRSVVINLALTFALVFWLEGMVKSRLFPALLILFFASAAIVVPFVDQLPLSIQRSLSFVPFLKVDPIAEMDAKDSTEWRLQMWSYVIPQVPRYLILGKGYSINPGELEAIRMNPGHAETGEGSALAGDYHNGPLSVVMPFGLFGVFGFLWFLYAGWKVLYQNYKFGDEAYQRLNTFLLAHYIAKVIFFFIIFGSLYSDLAGFTGLVGLSIAINGGVRNLVAAPVVKQVFNKFKLANVTR